MHRSRDAGRAWSAAGLVTTIALLAAAPAQGATADPFTQATPALKRGQIELLTLSTLPQTVTDGDVLVAVRGLVAGDRVALRVNGRSSGARLTAAAGGAERRALVRGLRKGTSTLTATVRGRAGRRVARLRIRNHPVTGPVISGPHQTPFICETERAGLGRPLDANCSIETRYDWFARDRVDQKFKRLEDPFAPYPDRTDTATTADGRRVPFVVRVESATINRGIARIAVLDDPRARGRDRAFTPSAWNGRLSHAFGESCGSGFHQGRNAPDSVLGGFPEELGADSIFSSLYGLTERLGQGDIVAHSTLTTFGVHCNPAVSAETLMMIKEHVSEDYGLPKRTFGVGGSGGALQQYNAANNFPGLLDAASPIASFTDVVTTAMTVVDCGLLLNYWDRAGDGWDDEAKKAVAGHITTSICNSWRSTFLPLLDPMDNCPGGIPKEARYDPKERPKGVRCSLPDGLVNIVGKDPATGFARRPFDNVGVQYGLRALQSGAISAEQFVDLNARIGGYDVDSRPVPQRSVMDADLAAHLYRIGAVVGRGSLDRIPIVDMASYLDLIPIADIHDDVRPFIARQRLRERRDTGGTMTIWRGLSLPTDTLPSLTSWVERIEDRGGVGDPRAVAAARPTTAEDRCIVTAAGASADPLNQVVGPLGLAQGQVGGPSLGRITVGVSIPERQEASGNGVCQQVFRAAQEPRMVAGGPLTDDVIKCRLKPVDAADYPASVTGALIARLREIFPAGVCDWSQPGVGETSRSMTWPSIGGTTLKEPFELRWTTGRSATVRTKPKRRG
jgi:hypothetical protein